MNQQDPKNPGGKDGLSRRDVLKCMAWAGSGVVWTMAGGCASSSLIDSDGAGDAGGLSFVTLSFSAAS